MKINIMLVLCVCNCIQLSCARHITILTPGAAKPLEPPEKADGQCSAKAKTCEGAPQDADTARSPCHFCDEGDTAGGWVSDVDPKAEELATKLFSDCNIEKVDVKDMTVERFKRDFRFRKPVIVTNYEDAKRPPQVSRASFVKTFGHVVVDVQRRGPLKIQFGEITQEEDFQKPLSEYLENMGDGGEIFTTTWENAMYNGNITYVDTPDLPEGLQTDVQWAPFLTIGASRSGLAFHHSHGDTGLLFPR